MENHNKIDYRMSGKYLGLQLKRVVKVFPVIILTTMILTLGLGLFVNIIVQLNGQEQSKQKVSVGVVGDADDSYLGIGIYALQHMDNSRFQVSFSEMEREEAEKSLETGEISAFVVIPEGFVDSVVRGENMQVTYVTATGSRSINSVLMDEIVESVSELITKSQSGIFGMQTALIEEKETDRFWELTDDLNIYYIQHILNRSDFFEVELLGYSNQLSFFGYYVCSMIMLFLLLWGMNGSYLFIKKDLSLARVLASKRVPAFLQVADEYLAYLVLIILSLLCVGGTVLIGTELEYIKIPEWEGVMMYEKWTFLLQLLPVAAMIAALQLLLYEFVSGVISGVLLQFLTAICLGYLSGCFYPISFFPERIQQAARLLPTGIGNRYIGLRFMGQSAGIELVALLLYAIVFLLGAMLVREIKIRKGHA